MTNLEMIKDMPVGQMADFIMNRGRCSVCVHFVDNECECEETPVPCYDGVVKWLNKEINPIPDLEIGDIIYSYYPEIGKSVCYVYLQDNNMWCCTDDVFVEFKDGMKKFIKFIYRKAKYTFEMEEIWRAE